MLGCHPRLNTPPQKRKALNFTMFFGSDVTFGPRRASRPNDHHRVDTGDLGQHLSVKKGTICGWFPTVRAPCGGGVLGVSNLHDQVSSLESDFLIV